MNRLREVRKQKGMTQTELAEVSGVARGVIKYLEKNERKMNVSHAERLAPILGVSMDYLMGTDAVRVVDSFSDALENIFQWAFGDIVKASTEGDISPRQKLLFLCVDHLLHLDLTNNDLQVIADLIQTLANKNESVKR